MPAGCFAAGIGFLLNFTISEHPPGSKLDQSSSTPASQAPLAPGQHRLTDDVEPLKATAAPLQQGRRQDSKGSKAGMGAEGGVPRGMHGGGQGGGRLEEAQGAGQKGQLLQGALAQIRVSSVQPVPSCMSCCPEQEGALGVPSSWYPLEIGKLDCVRLSSAADVKSGVVCRSDSVQPV